ncbi:MAG: DUF5691 domain-containing protein [Pseudomonadota bacterium]
MATRQIYWRQKQIWGGITRMLEDTFSRLEAAKMRWMAGGVADASGDPLADGSDAAEAQLRLLAQAALFKQSCLRPSKPGKTALRPLLPDLELPVLPDVLRPAFRQLMQVQDRRSRQGLIGFMAARGVLAHPFDWLPPQDLNGYPDAYIALVKWNAGAEQHSAALSADSWEDMYPAERQRAFNALRATTPEIARQLMEAHAGCLPADQRLALLDCFVQGLSPGDGTYLRRLASGDRSAKVKARALGLLARLDDVEDGEDARELADFMVQTKTGLVRRRQVIDLRDKLNPAQKKRVGDLFETVSFSALASALGVVPSILAANYVTQPHTSPAPFLEMCIRSAPVDALMTYWGRMRADGAAQMHMLAAFADRLTQEQMTTQALGMINAGAVTDFGSVLDVVGPDAGRAISEALLNCDMYRTFRGDLKSALAKRAKGESDYQVTTTIAQGDAHAMMLALLLTADAARQVISDLEEAGLHNADPILRPLKFNSALQGFSP